jgi:hypothetical protein
MAPISYWFTLMMLIHWVKTYTVHENKQTSLAVSDEIGLEVNAERTNYTVMSTDQNEGQNRNIKIDNKSFESVEHFKYLGATSQVNTALMKKLKADGAQSTSATARSWVFASFRLLSKNINIKVGGNIILLVVWLGREVSLLILGAWEN